MALLEFAECGLFLEVTDDGPSKPRVPGSIPGGRAIYATFCKIAVPGDGAAAGIRHFIAGRSVTSEILLRDNFA